MNTRLTGIVDFQEKNIVVTDTTINRYTLYNACILLTEQFPNMSNVPTTDHRHCNGEWCEVVNVGSYTLTFTNEGMTIESRDTFTFAFPIIPYDTMDIISFDTFTQHEKCVSLWIYLATNNDNPIRINTTRR